jgi:hypothetical protein
MLQINIMPSATGQKLDLPCPGVNAAAKDDWRYDMAPLLALPKVPSNAGLAIWRDLGGAEGKTRDPAFKRCR